MQQCRFLQEWLNRFRLMSAIGRPAELSIVMMSVMSITDMGMAVGALRCSGERLIPSVLVAVVGLSSSRVVPVTVSMAEFCMTMAVRMVVFQE